MKKEYTYLFSALITLTLLTPVMLYGQADMHAGHDHSAHDHAIDEEDPHNEHDRDAHAEKAHDLHEGCDHTAHEENVHDEHEGHGHDEHEEEGPMKFDDEIMHDLGIELAIASAGTLSSWETLPGEVRVNQDRLAHIVPRYPGLVTEVRAGIGDLVKEGQVLAVLESNESLALYEIKSFIEGTVIDKHITVGETLGDDADVFTIANLDTVWVTLTVFQKDLDVIHAGHAAEITAGHGVAKGVITYISPTLDEDTRTAFARVVLPNERRQWKPGMFVTGRVQTSEARAQVVVPTSAVVALDGEEVVFVRKADGFESRPVTVNRRTSDRVEITEGLEPGTEYVSSGAFHLKAEIITSGLGAHAGHGH